ncbi:MAG TPA: UPF0146 family protein [Methanoregula sp.]|nr:UPF0146 family protein [Methanoregula sp.]
MGSYKHIETCIGEYIAKHYTNVVEVGIGKNTVAARILHDTGACIRSTDIRNIQIPEWLPFSTDDVFRPDISLYEGAELIYAIRPAVEMIPPLITLARRINCDLLVYHLGFETYGNGGEKIECGVLLHRYFKGSESVKQR